MSKPQHVKTTLTAAIVASITLPALAAPQLEEIVVTAQKREQSLQDVSVSVAVTGGQEISEKAITTIENLSASLPAVQIASLLSHSFHRNPSCV